MKVILNKTIDLSNHQNKNLTLDIFDAEMINIQCENIVNEKITILGKIIEASDYTLLSAIDNSTYELKSEISKDGLYSFDVTGIDAIKFNIQGQSTAKLYIKVVK